MTNFFSQIAAGFVTIIAIIGGLFSPTPLSAPIPVPVASFSTSLASKITSTDTSMSLISIVTDDGTSLANGSIYGFVLDVGSADEEYVLGTASSSNIISMTRGVSVITGNTSVTALKKEHRRGASVKITDAPVILVLARILNGDETVPNILQYATSSATSTLSLNLYNIPTVGYVNNVASSGAADASQIVKGLVEAATITETAAGTATGTDTAALLFPQNKYFNGTSTATTTVVVSKANGKLSQGFLDFTEQFTFTGSVSSTGAFQNTSNTILATTTVGGKDVGSHLSKFGGDGSDGALSLSDSSTTIDLGAATYVTKNYSSITLTGSSTIRFTNPISSGSVIKLKVSGNLTMSASSSINAMGMGAAGGGQLTCGGDDGLSRNGGGGAGGASIATNGSSGAAGGASQGIGNDGTTATTFERVTGGAGGNTSAAGGTAQTYTIGMISGLRAYLVVPGSGGGSGGTSADNCGSSEGYKSGAGGNGGGVLIIEVAGSLAFPTNAVLKTSGIDGGAPSARTSDGCGGGGGGGEVIVLYNSASSAAGTITVAAGIGGTTTCSQTGGNGGAGVSTIAQNTEF